MSGRRRVRRMGGGGYARSAVDGRSPELPGRLDAMTSLGHTCDAAGCEREATQVGVLDLPGRRVELRLCDEHVDRLHAGKVRQVRQDRKSDGGWGRAAASFNE